MMGTGKEENGTATSGGPWSESEYARVNTDPKLIQFSTIERPRLLSSITPGITTHDLIGPATVERRRRVSGRVARVVEPVSLLAPLWRNGHMLPPLRTVRDLLGITIEACLLSFRGFPARRYSNSCS